MRKKRKFWICLSLLPLLSGGIVFMAKSKASAATAEGLSEGDRPLGIYDPDEYPDVRAEDRIGTQNPSEDPKDHSLAHNTHQATKSIAHDTHQTTKSILHNTHQGTKKVVGTTTDGIKEGTHYVTGSIADGVSAGTGAISNFFSKIGGG